MKLNYRGVTYDYNPPEIAVRSTGMRGNYRGVKHPFQQATTATSQALDANLIYRGVAYTIGNPTAAPIAEPAYAQAGAQHPDVDDLARALMMVEHNSIKNREQSLLLRTGLDVGLGVAASQYWSHIQGKINPGAHDAYHRSHVALS
jgi:hypothetical protein